MKRNRLIRFIKDMYFRFNNDQLLSTGAELTFFMLLSLFPFLIFFINLLSYTAVESLLDNLELLAQFLPANAYKTISEIVNQAITHRNGTLLSLGMLFTLWSSTSGVTSLIKGINRSFDRIETRPFWKLVLISIYITFELAIVIIASLLLIIFGKPIGKEILSVLGLSKIFFTVWNCVRMLIAVIAIFCVFCAIYHHSPNKKIKLREAIPGAAFVSIGLVVISFGFSFYSDNFGNYSNLYGSLSGIIALLTWIYISSIVFLIGSEINASLMFHKNGIKKEKFKRY